jgi:DNA-binding LytR/AlgR family response regulator
VRNAIGSLAEQLAGEGFVRVHKSAVVNRRKVLRITNATGRPSLVLEGGTKVQIGRKYRTAAEHIIEAASSAGSN